MITQPYFPLASEPGALRRLRSTGQRWACAGGRGCANAAPGGGWSGVPDVAEGFLSPFSHRGPPIRLQAGGSSPPASIIAAVRSPPCSSRGNRTGPGEAAPSAGERRGWRFCPAETTETLTQLFSCPSPLPRVFQDMEA